MSKKSTLDPFLCNRCQPYGYCLAAVENYKLEKPITEREISQWVPIRTSIKDATTKFGKKLQQAHELFHQDEFEQASYMYLDMYETRNDCDEVKIGLAASFFFLKRYEDAAGYALKLNYFFNMDFTNKFINLCELKSKEIINEIKINENKEDVLHHELISKNEIVKI